MHYREASFRNIEFSLAFTNHVFLFFKQHGHWRIDHHFDRGDAALGLRVQWTLTAGHHEESQPDARLCSDARERQARIRHELAAVMMPA